MHLIHTKIIFITALFTFLLLNGCSYLGWNKDQANNPSLQTNLFGQLETWESVDFDATPFSSLAQHSFCEEGGDYDPDISHDGKLIVFSSMRHSPNPDLYIKRIDGATSTRLTSDPSSEIQPCFSPSGDMVAYASNRSGNWDIWVVGIDGANPNRVSSDISHDIHPSWSPDGKHLVFCSFGTRSQQWELWVVNAENPRAKKWIGYGMFPEWSPDTQTDKIAFQLARFRGSQWFSIWTVDLLDGEARYPTEIITNLNHACICPSFSPDGRRIAYSSVGKSHYEKTDKSMLNQNGEDIWIVNLDGTNNQRLTSSDSADYSPAWSPNGRVFFCSDRKYIDNIWSIKPYEVNYSPEEEPIKLSSHPQVVIQAN